MAKRKNIVAAELLSVKDKVSLIDTLAFPIAGDHLAGLAGALVRMSPVRILCYLRAASFSTCSELSFVIAPVREMVMKSRNSSMWIGGLTSEIESMGA